MTKPREKELPWIKFWVTDWKADPALRFCSIATRGFWFELLLTMHQTGQSGEVAGSYRQLASIASCTIKEAKDAVYELAKEGAADVFVDGFTDGPVPAFNREHIAWSREPVTLQNRRMRREWNERKGSRDRKARQRERESPGGSRKESRKEPLECPAPVTAPSRDRGLEAKRLREERKSTVQLPLHEQEPEPGECVVQSEEAIQVGRARREEAEAVFDWFDKVFWPAYPRKRGKKKAAAYFCDKIKPSSGLRAEIMVALEAFKRSHDWKKDSGEFINHGSTWVRGEMWNDEPGPERAPASSNGFDPNEGLKRSPEKVGPMDVYVPPSQCPVVATVEQIEGWVEFVQILIESDDQDAEQVRVYLGALRLLNWTENARLHLMAESKMLARFARNLFEEQIAEYYKIDISQIVIEIAVPHTSTSEEKEEPYRQLRSEEEIEEDRIFAESEAYYESQHKKIS